MKAYQNQGIDVANTTLKSFNIGARDTQLCSKGQNRFVEYTHFTVEENKTLKSQLLSQGHSTTTTVANTTATLLLLVVKVKVTQPCPTLCNPMDCSLTDPSVRGILQARILEWVAAPFSRGSSQPRD